MKYGVFAVTEYTLVAFGVVFGRTVLLSVNRDSAKESKYEVTNILTSEALLSSS